MSDSPNSPLIPNNSLPPPPPRKKIHNPSVSSSSSSAAAVYSSPLTPSIDTHNFKPSPTTRHRHPNYSFGHHHNNHHNSFIPSLSQLNSPFSNSEPNSPSAPNSPTPFSVSTTFRHQTSSNNSIHDYPTPSFNRFHVSSYYTYVRMLINQFFAVPQSFVIAPKSWTILILVLSSSAILLVLKPWHINILTNSGYKPHPNYNVPGDYFPPISNTTEWNPQAITNNTSVDDPISLSKSPPLHLSIKDNTIYPHHGAVDAEWGFIDREPGNFERLVIGSSSPRSPTLFRKLGIIAIPAGEKAKPLVNKLVRRFGTIYFSFMIFHWDNSTWHEFSWYKNVIGVRSMAQTKFWFAKRFLTPDVVQNYDYVWLWDDDLEPEPNFDPVEFIKTLKKYHIHFAQPSLTWGEHGLQGPVVKKREGVKIGRFTTFIEVMMPVISRGAWPCAWRMIPWDSKATWGVDNVWYPACGAYGYCRFAVMDEFSVRHLDTRTFESTMQTNLAELRAYTQPFDALCQSLESPDRALSTIALPLQTFCRWWNVRDALVAFDSVRVINTDDAVNITACPDSVDFPNVTNVPWWHVR